MGLDRKRIAENVRRLNDATGGVKTPIPRGDPSEISDRAVAGQIGFYTTHSTQVGRSEID